MRIEKLKIFSKGNGWYTTATNYKDKEDKAYLNIYFTGGKEPQQPTEFTSKMLDCDARFDCYKGKVGLTIFDYSEIVETDPNKEFVESIKDTKYADKFGIHEEVKIDKEELPFY